MNAPTSDPVGELREAVAEAAADLRGDGPAPLPTLERPPRPDFGDYSTNAAMMLAPTLGEQPRATAERLGAVLDGKLGDAVDKVEVAGPGFLNLFMTDTWYLGALAGLLAAGERFGEGRPEVAERVNVEFVSANPTGPLHVASGRHAAYGDSLSRILELAGHEVEREYYVNDRGTQALRFGESIGARARGEEPPEGGYHGRYVQELADRIQGAAEADVEELADRGTGLMLEAARSITPTLVEHPGALPGAHGPLHRGERGPPERRGEADPRAPRAGLPVGGRHLAPHHGLRRR